MGYDIVFESERILFVRVNESLVDAYLKMINDEDIQNIIFEQLNCSPSDLTPFDLNKLKKDIEKYYKEVHKSLF